MLLGRDRDGLKLAGVASHFERRSQRGDPVARVALPGAFDSEDLVRCPGGGDDGSGIRVEHGDLGRLRGTVNPSDQSSAVYRFADDPRGPWHSFSHDRLDGPHWYASKSVTDDTGRRIAFGWIPDRNPEITPKTGKWLWGGDLAVPREIVLEDGELGARMPAEMGECGGSELAYSAAYVTGEWNSDGAGSFSVAAPGHFGHCLLESAEPADNYILSAATRCLR